MEKLVLEPKELLFLSAQLGASNFYGITDPFFGMTRDEVVGGIPQLQLQLEEKQLITLDFDGTVEIDNDVAGIISTCALCERYVSMDAISQGEVLPKKSLYIRGSETVELFQEGGLIVLRPADAGEFEAAVIGHVTERCSFNPDSGVSVYVPQDSLARANSSPEETQQALLNEGCSLQMSDVILAGLTRTGSYYMLTSIDMMRNLISDFVCVAGAAGAVRLEAAIDRESSWVASWIGDAEVKEIVHRIVRMQTGMEMP